MSDDKTLLKRHNFRAVISARAKVSLVDSDEFKEIIRTEKVRGRIPSGDSKTEFVLSTLTDYLIQIDEKLDRILDRLDGKTNPAGKTDLEVRETVDISGSGINLILNEEVRAGQVLRIAIRLPGFPSGRFEAYGEIVRTESGEEDGEAVWHAGIKFLNLSEEQRERLISYTFSQHRKQIRETVESKEN